MEDLKQVARYLEGKLNAGKNWLVFLENEFPTPIRMTSFFPSSLRAEAHCDTALVPKLIANDHWEATPIYYDAIINILDDIHSIRSGFRPTELEKGYLRELIARDGLIIGEPESQHQLLKSLASGKVIPASRKVSIIPENAISKYILVEHHIKPSSLLEDLRHECTVVGSYHQLAKGINEFKVRCKCLVKPASGHRLEYVLMGQFRGCSLILDRKGFPAYNTGIAISHGELINRKTVFTYICNPEREFTLSQYFFIRCDPSRSGIEFLDDRLKNFVPGQTVLSFTGHHFRSNPLGPLLNPDLVVLTSDDISENKAVSDPDTKSIQLNEKIKKGKKRAIISVKNRRAGSG